MLPLSCGTREIETHTCKYAGRAISATKFVYSRQRQNNLEVRDVTWIQCQGEKK